eukprot:TRINITY_DN12075_c0_g1_i1.p2 TRINITY_DN12075_c0_g1~~TRINITY_DN12075_c0_g1_i1.p2  ORF type:complete len:106 (+),score=8.72 TRINITY_DN12075_c0_g1_i1:790-1107(+)
MKMALNVERSVPDACCQMVGTTASAKNALVTLSEVTSDAYHYIDYPKCEGYKQESTLVDCIWTIVFLVISKDKFASRQMLEVMLIKDMLRHVQRAAAVANQCKES